MHIAANIWRHYKANNITAIVSERRLRETEIVPFYGVFARPRDVCF